MTAIVRKRAAVAIVALGVAVGAGCGVRVSLGDGSAPTSITDASTFTIEREASADGEDPNTSGADGSTDANADVLEGSTSDAAGD